MQPWGQLRLSLGVVKKLLVIAALAACSKTKNPNALSDADVARLKEDIAKATATVQAQKQSLAKGFTDDAKVATISKAQVVDTPCPRKYALPDDAATASYVQGKGGDKYSDVSYEVIGYAKTPVGKNVATYEKAIAEVSDLLAKGIATKADADRLRAQAAPTDELIVEGSYTDPIPMMDTFQPGTLYGDAYLFSYEKNRIICAAKLDVKNSAELAVEYTHNKDNMGEKMYKAEHGGLVRDLEVNIAKAVSANLHATEP